MITCLPFTVYRLQCLDSLPVAMENRKWKTHRERKIVNREFEQGARL